MDPKPQKTNKTLLGLIAIIFLVFSILLGSLTLRNKQNIAEKASGSSKLYISPSTLNVSKNEDLNVSVKIDTNSDQVTGIDLVLNFDNKFIHINSIEAGSDISGFSNVFINDIDNSQGVINFSAFTIDKSLAIKGSDLEILKINASIIPSSGNTIISFDPTSAVSATNESSSVLTDTSSLSLTIIAPTLAPTASPLPTSAPGEPNSCGGTCGSDSNCKSSYTCYKGYCRNPNCTWSNNCGCTDATSAPTPKVTNKPVTNKTSTPVYEPTTLPVLDNEPTNNPLPTNSENNFWENVYKKSTPVPVDLPSLAPIGLPESKNADILPWIIGTIVTSIVVLIIIIVRILKNNGFQKNNPPVIKI